MEREIRPEKQGTEYETLMLYHNIKKSDKERKIKKMIEKQVKRIANTHSSK